ncbi:MAG: ACT domain-containing protein [Gaiellaceae bacterium]
MHDHSLPLQLLTGSLAIARLPADAELPGWLPDRGSFVSLTRTSGELSVVCEQEAVPADVPAERGWRALAVAGTLDFALTGVLSSLAAPLAAAGVPIFVVSTHDTDYVLVRDDDLPRAAGALRAAGHSLA